MPFVNVSSNISIDIETERRLAWARSGLLTVLEQRKSIVSNIAPFSIGLWYAKRTTFLDVLPPRYGPQFFHKNDEIVILERNGYLRGLGSWWKIIDRSCIQRCVLWRWRPTFDLDWEKG